MPQIALSENKNKAKALPDDLKLRLVS